MKVIKTIETREIEVNTYIAEDGTEFATKFDCEKYEKDLNYNQKIAMMEKIEQKKDMDGKIPPHYIYNESDSPKYFKCKNQEEINLMNEVFDSGLKASDIGHWIVITPDNSYEFYDKGAYYYSDKLDDMLKETIEFYKDFGINLEVK